MATETTTPIHDTGATTRCVPTAPSTPASARSTRTLLGCGVAAGPLFLVTAFAQALAREGFDLRRHPFSMLSLGELGWVQIANFVVSGALFIAAAVGARRVLRRRRGGTWGPLLIGVFGLALIGGGVFVSDPALGFPAGTGDRAPEVLTWHAQAHGLAFAVGMTALVIAFVVFARAFAVVGQAGWSWYSTASGIAFVAFAAIGIAVMDWRLVAVALVVGWSWAALMAHQLRSARP